MTNPAQNANFYVLYNHLLELANHHNLTPLVNYLKNHDNKREIALRKLNVISTTDITRLLKSYNIF